MSKPTLGALYDMLTEDERKKAFFFLFGTLEFYADVDTWFAVMLMPDPPCGNIVRDYGYVDDRRKPGRRARIALQWICSSFRRVSGL